MLKKLLVSLVAILVLFTTSCAAKAFEEEINVVFMYEDEIIGHDTVTQFKNIKSPTLPDAYIPDGYKFFGWTGYDLNTIPTTQVKPSDENFKSKYIGAGKMVHWADVEEHKNNSTVILRPLMIEKSEIIKDYHYVVIAWYDKPATSGVDQSLMDTLQNKLFAYLRGQGVSEEDINSIVIRGYTGNVGTSCGLIMEHEDVDIMFGWGSASNVTTTGGMPESMLLETEADYKVGAKNRTIHRLTDTDSVKFVYEWLKSEECRAIFA